MVVFRHCPLYRLDIKKAILYGDLEDEVYMDQPFDFIIQGESSNIVGD